MSAYSHTRSLIGLLLLCLFLEIGFSLNVHFFKGVPVPEPANNNEETDAAMQLAKPATVVSLDALRETLERPLFSQSRRRIPKKIEPDVLALPSKSAQIVAVEPPSLQVIGIILFADSRQALIRRSRGGAPEWISEKDKVDGWILEGVSATQIILKNGERIEMVSLENEEPLNKTIPIVKSKQLQEK
ncbi:MAG: hypothetical protein HQL87_04345 [Magnetococcales bacterium]|nr:hypothetical protein [Magnetococcales bacterium]